MARVPAADVSPNQTVSPGAMEVGYASPDGEARRGVGRLPVWAT